MNAKECLAFAAQCTDVANRAAADAELQSKLFEMAETWLKVAKEMEIAEARRRTKEACRVAKRGLVVTAP